MGIEKLFHKEVLKGAGKLMIPVYGGVAAYRLTSERYPEWLRATAATYYGATALAWEATMTYFTLKDLV